MIYFTAHTFKCVCHCRRAMFRVLGMYNFGIQINQILTNDDEVCIPRLASILLAVIWICELLITRFHEKTIVKNEFFTTQISYEIRKHLEFGIGFLWKHVVSTSLDFEKKIYFRAIFVTSFFSSEKLLKINEGSH